MYFDTFIYDGPATTADFIVADACNIVATSAVIQKASYASGGSEEFKQLEKNFYSYQAGYLKSLYRMGGYNENFESYVTAGTIYDSYYIRFNELDKSAYQWGDYIHQDSTVILAVPNAATSTIAALMEAILVPALGEVPGDNTCITTTTTAAA